MWEQNVLTVRVPMENLYHTMIHNPGMEEDVEQMDRYHQQVCIQFLFY